MKALNFLEPKLFRTFRDKYPAVAMMVAALLISTFVSAQTDSLKYSQINGYGFKYKRMAFDSVLMVPRSSSPHVPYRAGAIRYNPPDSTLQLWTGYQWNSILTGIGNGIDTAYMINDTVLAIETPDEDFLIDITGKNIANSSLIANGDYIQNWLNHWFYLNNLKNFNVSKDAIDPLYPGNRHVFKFAFDSTAGTYPMQLMWGQKNVDGDLTDSVHFELTSTPNFTYLEHHTADGLKSIEMDWAAGSSYPNVAVYANGNSKNGYYEFGASTAEIHPQDSVTLKAVPAANADSLLGVRSLFNGVNTIIKIPKSAIATPFTLTNIGTGYSLVTTPNGSIKRLSPGYGVLMDSTTTANSITVKSDTSSTNHLVTQSDLNDAIGSTVSGINQLTGDVTAGPGTGSQDATIANNAVSDSKLRQSAALSIIGRSANSTGNVADITASTDGGVLRRNGSTLDFGAVDLASSNAVTGILPLGNNDTSSTNHVVTQSDLNDSSAALSDLREQQYGTIYNKNTWANTSDFTVANASTSIVGGKIQVTPSASGTFTSTMSLNAPSYLRYYKIVAKIKVNEITSTSYGVGVGVKSINPYITASNCARIGFVTGFSSNAGIELDHNSGGSFTTTEYTRRGIGASVNDYIVVTLERRDNDMIFSARNATTNSVEIDSTFSYYVGGPYPNNTGQYTLYFVGGSVTIDSLAVSSNEVKRASVALVGDSKTEGAGASTLYKGFAQLLPPYYRSVVNLGAGGDRTTEILSRINEIIALNPKQVILLIGSNDPRSGIPDATTKANYATIASILGAADIDVLYSLPYESSEDLSGLWAWIQATFPADHIINTYDVMALTGSLAGDNVHPSDLGHKRIAEAIIASNKIREGKSYQNSSIPNLQAVTDAGPTTTNTITVQNNSNSEIGGLVIKNNSSGSGAGAYYALYNDLGLGAFGELYGSNVSNGNAFVFGTTSGITNGMRFATLGTNPISFLTNSNGITNSRLTISGTGPINAYHVFSSNSVIQSTGNTAVPPSGSGIELFYSGGMGQIQSYDRTGNTPLPTSINGTGAYYLFKGPGRINDVPAAAPGFRIFTHDIGSDSALSQITLQQLRDSLTTTYTFSNGLTESGGTVKLGGTQTENIAITSSTSGRGINYTGINDYVDGPQLNVMNNSGSSGVAVHGESTNGRGIEGFATSGVGVYGLATSGTALFGLATTGAGLYMEQTDPSLSIPLMTGSLNYALDSSAEALWGTFIRNTGGTAQPYLGGRFNYQIAANDHNLYDAAIMSVVLTDVTPATLTSRLQWSTMDAGVGGPTFTLNGRQPQFNGYGGSGFTGTATKFLQVTAGGDVIQKDVSEVPTVSSGSSAPATTPAKIGDIYVDITAKKLYFATGTSSSADWTIAN